MLCILVSEKERKKPLQNFLIVSLSRVRKIDYFNLNLFTLINVGRKYWHILYDHPAGWKVLIIYPQSVLLN